MQHLRCPGVITQPQTHCSTCAGVKRSICAHEQHIGGLGGVRASSCTVLKEKRTCQGAKRHQAIRRGRGRGSTCCSQEHLSGLGGILMNVAGQQRIVAREVIGGQVLVHDVAVLDGICLYHHRILAHLHGGAWRLKQLLFLPRRQAAGDVPNHCCWQPGKLRLLTTNNVTGITSTTIPSALTEV